MMRSNLAILLAQRNIKITKVSTDTGISRTTLTSLYYNYAKGIQFDTCNTLCNYLKITPDRLLSYVPVDISFGHVGDYFIDVSVRTAAFECESELSLSTNVLGKSEKNTTFYIRVGLLQPITDEDEKNNRIILTAFQTLPLPFLSDLETEIISKLNVIEGLIPEYAEIIFSWDDDLDKYQPSLL